LHPPAPVLGSVAARAIGEAACPVLTVQPDLVAVTANMDRNVGPGFPMEALPVRLALGLGITRFCQGHENMVQFVQ
jgi:hypothetical protein